MSADENRKRIQELRRIGFQKLLTGVVLIFGVGVLCFIFLDENADSHSNSGGSYSSERGLGMVLLAGVFGLWNIVQGVIYFIRAQSGDEHYAKIVEDVIDSRLERTIGKRMARKDYSTRNVLVLLAWVFLFLAVVGGIAIGYLFWTRPR